MYNIGYRMLIYIYIRDSQKTGERDAVFSTILVVYKTDFLKLCVLNNYLTS